MSTAQTRKVLTSSATPLGITAAATTTASIYLGEKTTTSTTTNASRHVSSIVNLHLSSCVNLLSRTHNAHNIGMMNTLPKRYMSQFKHQNNNNNNNRINNINNFNNMASTGHRHPSSLLSQRGKSTTVTNPQMNNSSSTATSTSTTTSGSSTSSSSSSSKSSQGFLKWYEGHLQSRPVVTKAITGSFLWGLGDIVAQVVPPLFFDTNDSSSSSSSSSNNNNNAKEESKALSIDKARLGRAMFFGFAIHAPLSHVHFNFLEWMTIRGGFTGLSIPVFKAFMEQFVYWSWLSNSLYHGAMGFMTGLTPTQIMNRINDVLWETQKAQWVFWIPVQLLNFRFVPVRHQLNVVLMTSVVWTALLSAWYPPQDSNVDGDDAVVTAIATDATDATAVEAIEGGDDQKKK